MRASLIIASVLVTALVSPVLALTPITVCVTCRVARTPHSLHAEFAARHYAHEYPGLNVTTRFIGQYEADGTTQRGLIRAFVAQGDDCDLVVGPGSSSIAVAMNPLVESAWIDYSATSTELSSRFDFPLFNRVVPTDADATRGYAPLLSAANWRNLDLICSDSSYGRSVAAGLGDVAEGLGGHLRQSTCLSVAADESEVAAELQAVLARGYRVVFVAMGSSDPAFTSLIAAAQTLRATDRLIFLFSEAACSSAVQPWAALPGAFCATFALSESVRAPFLAAYAQRDTAAAVAAYQRMGWPANEVNLQGTGVFPAFAVDATRFALRALAAAAANNSGRALPVLSDRAAALRGYAMLDGVTGAIAIPQGDRSAADMVLINSRPGNQHLTVANITANGQMTVDASLFVLGAQTLIADLPSSTDENANSATPSTVHTSDGTPIALIVVVAVAAALLLAGGGAFATVRLRQKNGGRDNRFAPSDARKPFAVVFTDIQSSTALWATNPEAFGPAVDTHHAVLRAAVARHNGYEVKTIGDAFMLAFENVNDAVACALDVQSKLFTSKWPAFIDDVYKIQAEDSAAPCAELEDEDYAKLWAGVRVRIGVHFGTGDIKVDPVSQGYDYYGTVVNTAARVEGVAHGGQIVVTGAAFEAAQDAITAAKASVTVLGAQLLRGLPNAVELFQLVPAEIARREFPPLRLQVEHVVVEDEFDDGTTTIGGGDNKSNCDDPNAIPPEGADSSAAIVAIEGDPTITRCSRSSSAASLNAAATIGGGNGGGGVTRTGPPRERAVLDKRTPEYVCFRASKQNDGATYEGMLFQFNVLKAVVSTLPEAERRSIVRTLAERWRIGDARSLRGDGSRKSKEANSLATERVLALLAARAAPVAARYTTVQLTSDSPSGNDGLVLARQRSMTSAVAELARSVGPLSRSGRSNGEPLHSPQNADRSQRSPSAGEASVTRRHDPHSCVE